MNKAASLLVIVAVGCGSPAPDGRVPNDANAAESDAGPGDAGRSDAGAGGSDAGADAGSMNAGSMDAGPVGCPDGATCVDTFPFVDRSSTATSSRRDVARYGCAPDIDESGPERWYRIDVAEAGFLALSLGELEEGVDVDVHLLDASASCLDRGHWRAGDRVEPGRYWAVVDSYVEDGVELAGSYTLTVGLTRVEDMAAAGLNPEVAERALEVFHRAWERDDTHRLEYAVIDFSLHSREPREWVFDLSTGAHLWTLFVSHGSGSNDPTDAGLAATFSNVPESHQSSLGLLRTGELYVGDYGPSHRLDGLEPGINDNVRSRDIVMHPWMGSRREYVEENGLTQPTWGCPSIDDRLADEVRRVMANGALMWFWAPDPAFLAASEYL